MQIDAERAFDLMFFLIQEKPWLIAPGLVQDSDAAFEEEALNFLLSLDAATGWGDCSKQAQRLVATLLTDFMTKLKGPFSRRHWQVSADLAPWLQAVQIICVETLGSHPRLSTLQ